MDSKAFISTLKSLNINGAENLDADSFDYLFDGKSNISKFWSVFKYTISAENVLSNEEVLQYENIVKKGNIISEDHIKDIEQLFPKEKKQSNIDNLFSNSSFNNSGEYEDVMSIQTNMIKLQRLKLEKNLEEKRAAIETLKQDLKLEKHKAEVGCALLCEAQEEFLDGVKKVIRLVDGQEKEHKNKELMFQMSFEKLKKQELELTEEIEFFIHKQFQQKPGNMKIDSGSEFDWIHWVRGPSQEEYEQAKTMLPLVEKSLSEYLASSIETHKGLVCAQAELQEAAKLLTTIKNDFESFNASVKTALPPCERMKEALTEDVLLKKKKNKTWAPKKASEIVQQQMAPFAIKQQITNEYVVEKWNKVRTLLLRQLCRQDFLHQYMVEETEQICAVFDFYLATLGEMKRKREDAKERLSILSKLKNEKLPEKFGLQKEVVFTELLGSSEKLSTSNDRLFDKDIKNPTKASDLRLINSDKFNEEKCKNKDQSSDWLSKFDRNLSHLDKNISKTTDLISNVFEKRKSTLSRSFEAVLVLEEALFNVPLADGSYQMADQRITPTTAHRWEKLGERFLNASEKMAKALAEAKVLQNGVCDKEVEEKLFDWQKKYEKKQKTK